MLEHVWSHLFYTRTNILYDNKQSETLHTSDRLLVCFQNLAQTGVTENQPLHSASNNQIYQFHDKISTLKKWFYSSRKLHNVQKYDILGGI